MPVADRSEDGDEQVPGVDPTDTVNWPVCACAAREGRVIMKHYPLRLIAPAIGVAMIVGTCSLVKPPAPWIAAHPPPTGQPTGLTIDAVYQRVQQAISRPGLLYQATIRETSQQDGTHTTTTVQWVDAGQNVAREEAIHVDPSGRRASQTDLLTPSWS
jgi:hypothetical protein